MLRFYENPSKSLGYQGMDKILMITLISSQKSPMPNISAFFCKVHVLLLIAFSCSQMQWVEIFSFGIFLFCLCPYVLTDYNPCALLLIYLQIVQVTFVTNIYCSYLYNYFKAFSQVIIEKSRGEVSLMEQDKIENVSQPNFF